MPNSPQVDAFFDPATFTITYIVSDPASKAAAIIDSVLDYEPNACRVSTDSAEKVLDFVKEQGLDVHWILETHVHADHMSAAPFLKDALGAKTAIGHDVTAVQKVFTEIYNTTDALKPGGGDFDELFQDGDTFQIGGLTATVMHVPGHTPACVAYRIGDAVFVGDTLFMPDFGTARCDFPGGDARTLYRSIQRILSLPDETRIFVGHDYAPGGRDYAWETTVAAEKADNKHVGGGASEDAFVKMRTERDATLDLPRLLLPSIQVNMRGGHLPAPEDNGTVYIKLPVNVF